MTRAAPLRVGVVASLVAMLGSCVELPLSAPEAKAALPVALGATNARAVVAESCIETPTIEWRESGQLLIECGSQRFAVDENGREIDLSFVAAGAIVPSALEPESTGGVGEPWPTCWALERQKFIDRRQHRDVVLDGSGHCLAQEDRKTRVTREVGLSGALSSVQLNPALTRAAAICDRGGHPEVCLFDLDNWTRIPLLTHRLRQTAGVRRLVRNKAGSRVIAIFDDGVARSWDLARGTATFRAAEPAPRYSACAVGCGNQVRAIERFVFTPEGDRVIFAPEKMWRSFDRHDAPAKGPDDLERWNVDVAEASATPPPIADLVTGTNRWFLSATEEGSLELRHARGGPLLASIWPVPHSDSGYIVSPDGHFDTWGTLDVTPLLRCVKDGVDVSFDGCATNRVPGLLARLLLDE